MPPPQYPWLYAANYAPAQISSQNNPELGQLMSMFGGQALSQMFGPENFLPMLTPGMGVMDQYAMKKYQQQQFTSTQNIATANNQNLGQRLLAMRTALTGEEASETNKAQMEMAAGLLNFPITKALVGQLVGPENLEAALHGTKGDISQLHNVTARMGYFMRDPDGSRRMDAASLEDFTKGVYSHIYEEGGDLERLAADVSQLGVDERTGSKSAATLKKAANMRDETRLVTDAEFVGRVDAQDAGVRDRMNRVYSKYVQGDETDTIKQAEAISKIAPAIAESGILKSDEALISQVQQAAEERQVHKMHGLMAGQVGQLQEHLFQRGMLPQAIGAMKPAERVQLMSENINEETMMRLAEQYGHRKLMTNEEYRNSASAEERQMIDDYRRALPAEQRKMLEQRVRGEGGFLEELQATHSEIKKLNSGAAGAQSLDAIEEMGGFEAIAGNVDSKKTANALQKYSGVVDAVREIFGDNGNPNAPMPALLAALDHLSQGAAMQVDAKGIEAAMRQMQQVAKEAGIGFEQMAATANRMGAMGQALGLNPIHTMHAQVNAMAMQKTMQDTGAFSQPGFGSMNKQQAAAFVEQQHMAGAASDNSKAMAAAAYIYKNSKERFNPDSEFSAAMEAYLAGGDGSYEFNGETRNLFERVGEFGPGEVMRLFGGDGGKEYELMSGMRSSAAMEEMYEPGGFLTQKYEIIRDAGHSSAALSQNQLKDYVDKNPAAASALRDQNLGSVSTVMGKTITEMFMDTANLDTADQIEHVRTNLVPELTKKFEDKMGLDAATAQKLAQQTFDATIGTGNSDKEIGEQKGQLLAHRMRVDETIGLRTNYQSSLKTFGQVYGQDRPEEGAAYSRKQGRQAQQRAESGLGFKSHPLARAADYLYKAGETGQKITATGVLSEVLNVVPEQELAARYVDDMLPGLQSARERLDEITHTNAYLQDIASRSADDPAAKQKLTDLAKEAGIDTSNLKFVDDAAYKNAGKTAAMNIVANASEDRLRSEYTLATGESGKELTRNELVDALQKPGMANENFLARQSEVAFLKDNALAGSERLNDGNVKNEYVRHFNKAAGDLSADEMREQLLASDDYVLRAGTAEAEERGVTTAGRLANQIHKTGALKNKLREESSGTEQELAFLQNFNEKIMFAGDEKTRKKLERDFISAYGLEDHKTDNDKTTLQELEALIADTDPDSDDAKEKLRTGVAEMMAGYTGPNKAAAIEEAQKLAETMRVSSSLAPADAGITSVGAVEEAVKEIGDITTREAKINASGATIVIDGVNLGQMLKELQASQKNLDAGDKAQLSYMQTGERVQELKEQAANTEIPQEKREQAEKELKQLTSEDNLDQTAKMAVAAEIAAEQGIPVDEKLSARRTMRSGTGSTVEDAIGEAYVNDVAVDPVEFDKRVAAKKEALRKGETVSTTEGLSPEATEYVTAAAEFEAAVDKVNTDDLSVKQKQKLADTTLAAEAYSRDAITPTPEPVEYAADVEQAVAKQVLGTPPATAAAADADPEQKQTLQNKLQQKYLTAAARRDENLEEVREVLDNPNAGYASTEIAQQRQRFEDNRSRVIAGKIAAVELADKLGVAKPDEMDVDFVKNDDGSISINGRKLSEDELKQFETRASDLASGLLTTDQNATTAMANTIDPQNQYAYTTPDSTASAEQAAATSEAVEQRQTPEQKLDRIKELAKLSGIELSDQIDVHEKFGVPIRINGENVDFNQLTDGELDRARDAIKTAEMTSVSGMSEEDAKIFADLTEVKNQRTASAIQQQQTPTAPTVEQTAATAEAVEQKQPDRELSPPQTYAQRKRAELQRSREAQEQKISRAKELAALSGIELSARAQIDTRGNVPIRVNGQNIDFNQLTDDELENAYGALHISKSMSASNLSAEDNAVYEELGSIKSRRAEEKAAQAASAPEAQQVAAAPEQKEPQAAEKPEQIDQKPAPIIDKPLAAESAQQVQQKSSKQLPPHVTKKRDREKEKQEFETRRMERYAELAKSVGVDMNESGVTFDTRGHVPIRINDKPIDLNQLTDKEVKSAYGALHIANSLSAGLSEDDTAAYEELKEIRSKRAEEKQAATPTPQSSATAETVADKPITEEETREKSVATTVNEATAAEYIGKTAAVSKKVAAAPQKTSREKPAAGEDTFFAKRSTLNDKNASLSDRIAAVEAIGAKHGQADLSDEQMASLLGSTVDKVKKSRATVAEKKKEAAEQQKKETAASTVSSALPAADDATTQQKSSATKAPQDGAAVPTATSSARSASSAAESAVSSVSITALAAQSVGGSGSGGPKNITIEGELSIVNLEKAVITAQNNAGAVTDTAGDMPVISSNS